MVLFVIRILKQKNKLNLYIYGIHLLNPYKTVVSHLKCIEHEKTSVQVYLHDNIYDMYILYIFTFWFVVRFACTPHGPSAKFLVENGE